METLNWTDFAVLIFIKTLRSSNRNEEKLVEYLNKMYNAAEKDKRVLEIVTMQAEVLAFWRNVKENREMTWGKGGKDGKKDKQRGGNQGGGNQGGGGQGGKSNGGQGRRKNKQKNRNKGKEDKDEKDEKGSAVGVQGDNNVKYCFKCGDSQHFARDCKKTGLFSCSVHLNALSLDR